MLTEGERGQEKMILARQKVVKRVKVCMEMSSSRESVDPSFNLDSSVKTL